jgi:hypothetical protein
MALQALTEAHDLLKHSPFDYFRPLRHADLPKQAPPSLRLYYHAIFSPYTSLSTLYVGELKRLNALQQILCHTHAPSLKIWLPGSQFAKLSGRQAHSAHPSSEPRLEEMPKAPG